MADIGAGIQAAFCLGFGSVSLYMAGRLHRKRQRLLKIGLVAEGVVVRLEKNDDPESSSYHPVIRFTGPGQEPVVVRHDIGGNPPAYQVGQRLVVRYDPQAPATFVIGMGSVDWDALIWGLIGACLLGFTLYLCISPYC